MPVGLFQIKPAAESESSAGGMPAAAAASSPAPLLGLRWSAGPSVGLTLENSGICRPGRPGSRWLIRLVVPGSGFTFISDGARGPGYGIRPATATVTPDLGSEQDKSDGRAGSRQADNLTRESRRQAGAQAGRPPSLEETGYFDSVTAEQVPGSPSGNPTTFTSLPPFFVIC